MWLRTVQLKVQYMKCVSNFVIHQVENKSLPRDTSPRHQEEARCFEFKSISSPFFDSIQAQKNLIREMI